MERVKYTEIRKVDGNEITVITLERLEYSGEWVPGGYRIISGEKTRWLFGWPSDNDLRSVLL